MRDVLFFFLLQDAGSSSALSLACSDSTLGHSRFMAVISYSDLPCEIIGICVKRMNHIEDIVRCSALCKSWKSVVVDEMRNRRQPGFSPWLMLSPPDDDSNDSHQLFFSLDRKKLLNIDVHGRTQGRQCWGSPFGWVLTFGLDLNIHLFNPLSKAELSLPSQPTFEHQYYEGSNEPPSLRPSFLQKLVLSSNPSDSPSHVQVMAIYGPFDKLAFAKPGDEAWTSLRSDRDYYRDAIFFRGQFFAVTHNAHLMICETANTNCPKATDFALPPNNFENHTDKVYLIEMCGDIHMIYRFCDIVIDENYDLIEYKTDEFLVYKLDFHTKTWIELEDLGDNALFVGHNSSFAISTSHHPKIRGNCIYYTDDHRMLMASSFCDMGVYDFKNCCMELVYKENDNHTRFTRPFIFMPNF